MPDFPPIEALVLAGGAGTRLRGAVPGLPKALAPVAGRPFVDFLLRKLVRAGVRRTILCTGHLGGMIRDSLGDSAGGMPLDYSLEREPLGTGGALRLAAPRTTAGTLLVMNGDSFCDAPLEPYVEGYLRSGLPAGILLARVADGGRFGAVSTSEGGTVTRFSEKEASAGPGWINAGAWLLDRRLVEAIPPGRFVSLERDLVPGWIPGGIYGHRTDGAFIDIGTPESYLGAETFFRKVAG